MPPVVDLRARCWTYGAEHELADWDALAPLPEGFARSPDHTIVNSNSIAAQPDVRLYRWGGEFNTPPTTSPEQQADLLPLLLEHYPTLAVNHRSNLHLHVRVPGLARSLRWLKELQRYIHAELPTVLPLLEPIPPGTTPAERKRARRRKVSHHTLLTPHRVEHQLAATDITSFFEREVPTAKKDGKPMWHAQPRLAVGVRQLLQTDTIEFRHFPGTLDRDQLLVCLCWCRDFLLQAFQGLPLLALWHRYVAVEAVFPKFPEFKEELEVGYQATASGNGLSKEEVIHNIKLIEGGTFYGSAAYTTAAERAGVVSR